MSKKKQPAQTAAAPPAPTPKAPSPRLTIRRAAGGFILEVLVPDDDTQWDAREQLAVAPCLNDLLGAVQNWASPNNATR
jgi:hypothetical protein